MSKAAKGKKSAKGGGAEDKREDVLQAVLIADTFQQRFQPFAQDKPRVRRQPMPGLMLRMVVG